MDAIVSILYDAYIDLRTLMRLRRVNTALHSIIMNDVSISGLLSRQLRYKKKRSAAYVLASLARGKPICRECLAPTNCLASTTTGKVVSVCVECTKSGFSRLVSRKDIHLENMRKEWRMKMRAVDLLIRRMHVAKISHMYCKMYWAHEATSLNLLT